MLKQQFENLLAAERDARDRIANAELEAKQIFNDARAARGQRLSEVRDETLRETDAILEQVRAESAAEKTRIIEAAHAKADAMVIAADNVDDAFVQRAARAIAGLES